MESVTSSKETSLQENEHREPSELSSHFSRVFTCGLEWARNVTDETVKFVKPVVLPLVNPIIEPIISVRPKELISDTIDYTVPFISSHTAACVHYVKRRIRISVYNREKENGVLSFSVDPREAWLLDMDRISVQEVLTEVNTWLVSSSARNESWPKKITWVEQHPLKSKVNHGNHFIVHYWWSPTNYLL